MTKQGCSNPILRPATAIGRGNMWPRISVSRKKESIEQSAAVATLDACRFREDLKPHPAFRQNVTAAKSRIKTPQSKSVSRAARPVQAAVRAVARTRTRARTRSQGRGARHAMDVHGGAAFQHRMRADARASWRSCDDFVGPLR